jgi:predicted metal-binding protein
MAPKLRTFFIEVKPVIDYNVRTYCTLMYPGHPKGCPMYGKRPECPPQAPMFEDYFDIDKGFVAVVCEFDIVQHQFRMLSEHPHWTERQQRNPLYWQNSVRKALTTSCRHYVEDSARGPRINDKLEYTLIPEAMGVDVVATMRAVKIHIEFPALTIVRKVAIIGVRKEE